MCGTIFERLIFNSLYQFLEEHNLLSINQSDFRSNDSFINQLLFIVHTLYKAFNAYPTLDAKGVFLDMSKAFDKVWHEGLIYKLKSTGVSDSLLKLFQSFLTNRFQKSLTQWSDFRMVACKSRCATRVYSWSTPFSNIDK